MRRIRNKTAVVVVVAIGVAMIMDWLVLLPRWFNFAGV